MGSKVNSQQAPVQWLREITKAKLNPFLFPSFYQNNGKRGEKGNLDIFWQVRTRQQIIKMGKKEIRTYLGKFGQFRASLGKLGQVRTRQQIGKMGGKGTKNKKREQKFEW